MKVANILTNLSKSDNGFFSREKKPSVAFSLVTFNRNDLINYIRHYPIVPRPGYCQSTKFKIHSIADPMNVQEVDRDLERPPSGMLCSMMNEEVAYLIPTRDKELPSPHAIMLLDNPAASPNYCTFKYYLPINLPNK